MKVKCQNCGKYLIGKGQKKFCSRSCAASKNNTKPRNRLKPTTKTLIKYGQCNKCKCHLDYKKRRTLCENCRDDSDMTLAEATYTRHHKSSAYALVRSRARKIAKDLGMNTCEKCGYNIHVEIAHKKAVSTFDKNTLLSEINHPLNLMALCPNCHWEHDNLE